MRPGDKVKSNIGVADLPRGTQGVVLWTNGYYIYVRPKNQRYEVEYLSNELDVIEPASDARHKVYKMKNLEKNLKSAQKRVQEALNYMYSVQKEINEVKNSK